MKLRRAQPADAEVLHQMIVELAIYEQEPDAVEATPESLAEQLSQDGPPFECLLGELDGEPVAFALFFHNYSTWRGSRGLYLEDLYVRPHARGRGYGRAILTQLAALAHERGCARMEWAVLDWNRSARDFYESLGARPVDGWVIYRADPEQLSGRGSA